MTKLTRKPFKHVAFSFVTTFSYHTVVFWMKKNNQQTTLSHGNFIKHMECKNRNTSDQKNKSHTLQRFHRTWGM